MTAASQSTHSIYVDVIQDVLTHLISLGRRGDVNVHASDATRREHHFGVKSF